MSTLRNLITRSNRTKTLTTSIRGSSLGYKITPHSHIQTSRFFSIKSWFMKSVRESASKFENFSVSADLQGNINFVGPHGKVLPKELSRTVVKLSCESSADGGICDVYLVGTCHVSEKSCQEVKAVIDFLKPQVVFLELCLDRVDSLLHLERKVPTVRDLMTRWWKSKRPFWKIYYDWFFVKHIGVSYGMEFRVAYEEAGKLGSKVVLGDRRREKMIDEWSAEEPAERDQYMSAALLKVARDHNSVVAIVGIGHLEGIKKYWKQPTEFQLKILGAKLKVRVDKKIIELHECEQPYHHSDSELGVVFET